MTRVMCIGERGRDMPEVCSTPTITERSTQASVGDETNSWLASVKCMLTRTHTHPYTTYSLVPTHTTLTLDQIHIVGFDS